MNIRVLTADDAAEYREMRLRSYQNDPFAFSESYEDEKEKGVEAFAEELSTTHARPYPPEWFVIGSFSENGKLNGFVKFRRDLRSKARHKSMIHAMYVDPDYRTQGVGRLLIEYMLIRARQLKGLEQIHLWVLHSGQSVSASDFYRKCGFKSQGPYVKQDLRIGNQYIDAEYMVMYLD